MYIHVLGGSGEEAQGGNNLGVQCCGFMVWVHGVGSWCGFMVWVHGVGSWCGFMVWGHGVGSWCGVMVWGNGGGVSGGGSVVGGSVVGGHGVRSVVGVGSWCGVSGVVWGHTNSKGADMHIALIAAYSRNR